MSKTDEVAELRAHIARLESELEQARNPVPVDPDISMDAVGSRFRMPSRRQGELLFNAAARVLPQYAEQSDLEHFLTAIKFFGSGPLQIIDQLDESRYVGYWLDQSYDWCRGTQQPITEIGLPGFLLGCAAARVPYRLPNPRIGVVAALGLVVGTRSSYGGGSPSRPLRNSWLYSIAPDGGEALAPTPPGKVPRPSTTKLMQLDMTRGQY